MTDTKHTQRNYRGEKFGKHQVLSKVIQVNVTAEIRIQLFGLDGQLPLHQVATPHLNFQV